ncbi:alpha/beta fold hydrolase [Rhodoferax antarcticus]|uniref:Alpha/beta hydrolase fold family protein n=1 Tax=Rhodoferax antarcticus ANT.BR TaxID=1111071 RepID=A0A1Q8YHZ3_9BURK|nr:alpha/beta hydrolase [Rhodoferax antarcticus]APW45298.1 alpha/beta hydrolase [Rhodoferax antarcticus]MCW2311070.1 pimeloyl-ACP methyl ester carboxylesterase [Rhodoferax antarcticus]OLP07593.1 alpha/beta hydrolase fold family protein [Rhodoferax antarcticus ANT.BR]
MPANPWIFLRGLTRESRHWGGFVEQFQQVFPNQPVVVLDLAGNGLQNHRSSHSRVEDMVEDCRTQLAQRHIAPPYQVLAMSLGAMVSVAWAQAHPQELTAQVLINTSLRPYSPFYQRLQPANYATLLRLLLTNATPEAWERAILHMTSNSASTAALPLWLQLRQQQPVSQANALRQLLAAARFQAPAGSPTVPTLLLASEHDHLVCAACSRSLAQNWGCPLRLHPSAGHDLPLDDGPWVAAQVRQWLALLSTPAAASP